MTKKQKRAEILLAQEKLKTEFLANATHELRTPLAIMKGNIDLALLEKGNSKSITDTLSAVNTEIKILSETLKDLALLTSTPKNTENVLELTDVDVSNLLTKTAKRLETVANEKNIKIKIKKERGLMVSGDEKYLEKLFLNLIKNAITYGKDNGNILTKEYKDKNTVIVDVTDDGIGISEEDLPKIFERFFRADRAHSSYQNHSGLGLAIAKWVAEIHGGSIKVKSTPGEGSTFTVTLPRLKD